MQPSRVIDCKNKLGECPVWDYRIDRLLWTDILSCQLFCWDPASGALERFDTPFGLCSFGLTCDPGVLIAAFEQGFAWYNFRSQAIDWITRPHAVAAGSGRRLNDGRVSPAGEFWCGSMVTDATLAGPASGAVYRLGADEALSIVVSGLEISNGICFSNDEKIIYYADSGEGVIYRIKPAATVPSGMQPQPWYRARGGVAPDGAVTDQAGRYWSAMWGGAEVVALNSDGIACERIAMPVSQPSCVAFGGPGFSTLFVTSARQGLTEKQLAREPLAGNLFVYDIDGKGLPEPVFGRSKPAI